VKLAYHKQNLILPSVYYLFKMIDMLSNRFDHGLSLRVRRVA